MQPTEHAGIAAELSKAALPVTVGGMSLLGVPLNDWVLIVTLIYLFLQIGVLLRDKLFSRRKDKHGRE